MGVDDESIGVTWAVPSCRFVPLPQHQPQPLDTVSEQVCVAPAERNPWPPLPNQFVDVTSVGTATSVAWPLATAAPQQNTSPVPGVRAQECAAPHTICEYTRPPATATGAAESAPPPLPRRPFALLPKHHALPAESRPQVWLTPAASNVKEIDPEITRNWPAAGPAVPPGPLRPPQHTPFGGSDGGEVTGPGEGVGAAAVALGNGSDELELMTDQKVALLGPATMPHE